MTITTAMKVTSVATEVAILGGNLEYLESLTAQLQGRIEKLEGDRTMTKQETKTVQIAGLMAAGAAMDREDRRLFVGMTVEERLQRLEDIEEQSGSALFEAALGCLKLVSDEEGEPKASRALPVIKDKASFAAYIAEVTQQLNAKLITGPEARALLYAAQLSLSAIR